MLTQYVLVSFVVGYAHDPQHSLALLPLRRKRRDRSMVSLGHGVS